MDYSMSVLYREELVNARGDVYGLSQEWAGQFIGFAEDYNIVVVRDSSTGEIKRIKYQHCRLIEKEQNG